MTLLIARHGESEANVLGVISNRELPHGLTPLGALQALTLADKLVVWDVNKLYSSPIPRAKETAEIVAAQLKLPVILEDALREFDCGGMEGRGDEAAWQAHHQVTAAWDDGDYDRRIPPDGESYNNMKARFLPFITQLLIETNRNTGDVLLIGHGGMLHQMLPLMLANVERAFTQAHPLGNCELVVAQVFEGELVCRQWMGKSISM